MWNNLQPLKEADKVRKAYIMWQDIPIAELYHQSNSKTQEEAWIIKPIWKNYPKCMERGEIVDIPGIAESKRKEQYCRRATPVFIKQRLIPETRPEMRGLLAKIGLAEYDAFEVLCRTHGVCCNNDYYISRTPDKVIDVHSGYIPYDVPE